MFFSVHALCIPPADSTYFNPASFGDIQSLVLDSDNRAIVIGDFNSRMSSLQSLSDNVQVIVYSLDVDQCDNAHGWQLRNMCLNLGIYPVNHLNYINKRFFENTFFRSVIVGSRNLTGCLF